MIHSTAPHDIGRVHKVGPPVQITLPICNYRKRQLMYAGHRNLAPITPAVVAGAVIDFTLNTD